MILTNEEKHNLPINAHYFASIFFDLESATKNHIQYSTTFEEAAKACKDFAKKELEYWYNREFEIREYKVARNIPGQFKGSCIRKWTNTTFFTFEKISDKEENQ